MKNVVNLALSLLMIAPLTTQADDQSISAPPSNTQAIAPATPPKAITSEASDATKADPKALTVADASVTPPTVDTRYGIWDALDKRSVYGQGVFPEPFLVDDSDGEVNEGRLDW